MIQKIIILGSGTAGLIAALSLKRSAPHLKIQIIRDPEMGVIGVGEGTTANFPDYLFNILGIKRRKFHQLARPTWKLGIRFLWGPRKEFYYSFGNQMEGVWRGMNMPIGYFCDEDFDDTEIQTALMRAGKAFARLPNREPNVQMNYAFHVENEKLVASLEEIAVEWGATITDGKMVGVDRGAGGIEAIHLADGQRLEADFFIDASGFRSELLGKALEEPFESFDKTLFCDRAVIGGWDRTDEELLPFTTAETMDSGWCWQIEHEHFINRGYVYCSDMISDDEAVEEFKRKNPKVPAAPRLLKFRSGCYRRMWVENVVAIGNSGGFVEPLEATAIMIIVNYCQLLNEVLRDSVFQPTDSIRKFFNQMTRLRWHGIRDFLGLHYRLNTVDQTPFWKRCQIETDLSGIGDFLEFYAENGPSLLAAHQFPENVPTYGLNGHLVMMMGNKAPYRRKYKPTKHELSMLRDQRSRFRATASKGIGVKEMLAHMNDSRWKWPDEQ